MAAMSLLPSAEGADGGWDEVPRILARIKPPVFPRARFDVKTYGAVGDGKTDCSVAITKAIVACNGAGGGTVTFPAGVFSEKSLIFFSYPRPPARGLLNSCIARSRSYSLFSSSHTSLSQSTFSALPRTVSR